MNNLYSKNSVLLSVFAVFTILSLTDLKAQNCAPPTGVTLFVSQFDNFSFLEWTYAEDCDLAYFEIEFAPFPFEPGQGAGALITPVFFAPQDLGDSSIQYAWIRALCYCPGGGGLISSSAWVGASVYFVPPPIFPDEGINCSNPPEVEVATALNCGELSSDLYFLGIFQEEAMVIVPCSGSSQFVIWRHFTAGASGGVEITMSGWTFENGDWSDFGAAVFSNSCAGELQQCIPTFSDSEIITLNELTPNQEYYIAFWNNSYPYFYLGGNEYNGVISTLDICEIDGVTALNEEELSSFVIYPNPSDGIFQIQMPKKENVWVEVFDLNGKLVFAEQLSSSNNATLNLTGLSNGVYTLKLHSTDDIVVERIVLK